MIYLQFIHGLNVICFSRINLNEGLRNPKKGVVVVVAGKMGYGLVFIILLKLDKLSLFWQTVHFFC